MRFRLLALAASTLVLSSVIGLRADLRTVGPVDHEPWTLDPRPQKSVLDGVYSKAQADGAKAQFDKLCAECHAFTVATKRKAEDLPLGDEPFFKNWAGKPIAELVSLIVFTMPNDGRAAVDEAEALNLMAYILQQNGFPAGSSPLTKDAAAAVIARPKT